MLGIQRWDNKQAIFLFQISKLEAHNHFYLIIIIFILLTGTYYLQESDFGTVIMTAARDLLLLS
jgi:hypothetical protein